MVEIKKFNNRPNSHVKYYFSDEYHRVTSHDYWISRAVAVVGVIFAMTDINSISVLITKRSSKMYDEAGKLGVPCGYLDWEESCHDAMIREVYEETSLYLPDYRKFLIFDNDKQPFRIKDNPNEDKRQNVSQLYVSVYDFRGNADKFPTEIEKYTCVETAWVKWLPLLEFYNTSVEQKWAFNHDETIKSALQFYNKHFGE